jgi:hypothetical protein
VHAFKSCPPANEMINHAQLHNSDNPVCVGFRTRPFNARNGDILYDSHSLVHISWPHKEGILKSSALAILIFVALLDMFVSAHGGVSCNLQREAPSWAG